LSLESATDNTDSGHYPLGDLDIVSKVSPITDKKGTDEK